MKKAFGLLLVVGLLVAAMATAAFAAVPGDGTRDYVGAGSQAGNGYSQNFVDVDPVDGINDNFVDVDGDKICDNFVDEDGDGFSDLRVPRSEGAQGPHGNGTGVCDAENFVDANNDGICDTAGSGGGQQRMGGRSL